MELDPLTILRQRVAMYPTQTAAAKALGVSRQFLSHILRGRSGIGPKLARRLGLKLTYVVAKEAR